MALFASILFITAVTRITTSTSTAVGVLYPRATESREVLCLDGNWTLRIADVRNPNEGFTEHWFSKSLHEVNQIDFHSHFTPRPTITSRVCNQLVSFPIECIHPLCACAKQLCRRSESGHSGQLRNGTQQSLQCQEI